MNKKKVHVKKNSSSKGRASTPAKVITAPKKSNPHTAIARFVPREKNPSIFGVQMKPVVLGKAIGGTLIGVAATKLIPPRLPLGEIGTSQAGRVVVSGVVAFALGYGARQLDPIFGDGVIYGGLLQTVSVALNEYLPQVGGQIGLRGGRGVGYIVPGQFTFPENPVKQGIDRQMSAAVMPAAAVAGIGKAFRRPF